MNKRLQDVRSVRGFWLLALTGLLLILAGGRQAMWAQASRAFQMTPAVGAAAPSGWGLNLDLPASLTDSAASGPWEIQARMSDLIAFRPKSNIGLRTSIVPFTLPERQRTGPRAGLSFGLFGTSQAGEPALRELMRKSFSRAGAPGTLEYRQPLWTPGLGTGPDYKAMIMSGMLSTPDLGNGVSLSAGTSFGGRALPGAPKHSGPSVGLKLTF